MFVSYRILLKGALRDRISLFYAVVFPIGLILGLGAAFPTPDYRGHLLPGAVALSLLFFSCSGVAFESLAQRNRGVYKLLRATPYRTVTFVTCLTSARATVALLSGLLVATVGTLAYGLRLTPQAVLLALPLLALATLCFTFIGLAASSFAQSEGQVAMLTNVVTLPMVFGSEAFYSLTGAPGWLRALNTTLPFGHLLDGLRPASAGN